MKKLLTLATIVIICLAIYGCQKTEIPTPDPQADTPKGMLKTEVVSVDFIVAQNILAGEVTITNDADSIYISADITGSGWEFDENHIYAGMEAPPKPAPGQFPYVGNQTGPATIEFALSFEDLGTTAGDIYIAFHADVTQGSGPAEGGWAIPADGGIPWLNKRGHQIGWGVYFTYTIQAQSIDLAIENASTDISTVNTWIRYRNLRLDAPGQGDEIRLWPPIFPLFPYESLDFYTLPPAGSYNYFLSPGLNHITLIYVPFNDGQGGTMVAYTLVDGGMTEIATVFIPETTFDVIQFKLYSAARMKLLYLNNIKVNGYELSPGSTYRARSSGPMWNITGSDLVSPAGSCIFEADIEIFDPASSEEELYVEVRFGAL